jgi:hypothetical protein
MFIISLKYSTASATEPYTHRINALVAPVAAIPLFFFQNYDILMMGILVLITNLWVSWKQLDTDDYSWSTYYREEIQK